MKLDIVVDTKKHRSEPSKSKNLNLHNASFLHNTTAWQCDHILCTLWINSRKVYTFVDA